METELELLAELELEHRKMFNPSGKNQTANQRRNRKRYAINAAKHSRQKPKWKRQLAQSKRHI